tara:strand:+ start:1805 stop:2149 length:345 start_codon:yes stop_codon:yes gene_type:complete
VTIHSTIAQLQEHLASAKTTQIRGRTYRNTLPRITCADGTTLSVQAGECLYCSPRDDAGPWHQVEVGFPSKELPSLAEYAEEPDRPTSTVYGWVPIDVVAAAIDDCGGIEGGAS